MKLPVLAGRQVHGALRRLGFQEIQRKGKHVTMEHADGRRIVALASGTSMANASTSSGNRRPGAAHGTRLVRTPCSGPSARGNCARNSVSNGLVSRCRQVRSAAGS
jgi:predicted RNA binding protein YcfA (HicA-like mRNA interferase family)